MVAGEQPSIEKSTLRKKQLTHRRHYYRETAAALVAKKLIVLEDINLNDFAKHGTKTPN